MLYCNQPRKSGTRAALWGWSRALPPIHSEGGLSMNHRIIRTPRPCCDLTRCNPLNALPLRVTGDVHR